VQPLATNGTDPTGSPTPLSASSALATTPVVHSLTCHRDLALAVPCLSSLLTAVGTSLVLHEDGTLTDPEIDHLLEVLPRTRIVRRRDTEPMVVERLSRYPACRRYRAQHPLSNKLLDIPLSLPPGDTLRFCDSDVLFFRRLTHLFPDDGRPIFCEEDNDGYSTAPWKLRFKFGFRIVSGLNSGLFQFPLRHLDLDFLEWFLGKPELMTIPGMGEQTAWALLLRNAWPDMFATDQIFCSTRRPLAIDDHLVAVHFLYHLKSRVPEYVPQALSALADRPPAQPEFQRASPLSAWRIAERRLLRRWRSRLN
jgi:hypothetical protein